MDVALNTNTLSIPNPNLNKPSATSESDLLANRNIGNNFNSDEAIMDLKEVQDFLFMLIGSKSPSMGKGANVNLQA